MIGLLSLGVLGGSHCMLKESADCYKKLTILAMSTKHIPRFIMPCANGCNLFTLNTLMSRPVEAQVTKNCAVQASTTAACSPRWISIIALQHLHLPACAECDDAVPVQGATALHIACQTCNTAVVEVLVKHGAPLSFDASSACKVKLCLCLSSSGW